MKKLLVILMVSIFGTSTGFSQEAKTKKDWDPVKRAERIVSKFSEVYTLDDAKKAELKNVLASQYAEMKALNEKEGVTKAERKTVKDANQVELKKVLGDEGFIKFQEFKKAEQEARKAKKESGERQKEQSK